MRGPPGAVPRDLAFVASIAALARRALAALPALLAAAALAAPSAVAAAAPAPRPSATAAPARPRVAVLWDEGFPAVDAPAPDRKALAAALSAYETRFLPAGAFSRALEDGVALAVLPYGSAFPEEAWRPFLLHLTRGGSWLNLGGAPLAVPVALEGGRRLARPRTTQLHRRLGLVRAEPVDAAPAATAGLAVAAWRVLDDRLSRPLASLAPSRTFALDVRLAEEKDRPDEDGSEGLRLARLVPLVHGLAADGTPLAAPVVAVDRLRGEMAGGRWVLATCDASLAPAALRALAAHALEGPSALTVAAPFALYRPDEGPTATVQLVRPGRESAFAPVAHVEAFGPGGRPEGRADVPLRPDGRCAADPAIPRPLAPGLHTLRVRLDVEGPDGTVPLEAEGGFLVAPAEAVAGGPVLGAGRDLLTRDGVPFAVAGMTAMQGGAHRRFLLEPDPLALERDFAAMQAAGVNLVRTGIWTGWRELAPGGVPTEPVLRALEAFLLTARRHGMPVVFTLFAFLPETWGGGSAYLDPRAVAAQERFAAALARRLAGARDLAWDLINEPSFASPSHLWQTRPDGTPAEAAAFRAFLLAREGRGRPDRPAAEGTSSSRLAGDGREPEAEREARVVSRWRGLPGEPIAVPAEEDFADRYLSGRLRPSRALDFRLFAQGTFASWVKRLAAAIRAAGSSGLVTVGTDEGGAGEMPNPLFFGEETGFTGTHTWWNHADLLWDLLAARLPDRPALVGETGLMSYERLDGTPLRSAAERRLLLARKLATALGGGGAGFVPWIWATDPYLPSDNEAGIGLFRADGTARPELADFRAFARFAHEAAPLLGDQEPARAAVLVPHSRMLSVRDQATEATRRAVRLLEYELGVATRLVAEHRAARDLAGARLVVVPSPSVLRDDAWEALLAAARGGATVVVSGALDEDPWLAPRARLAALGLDTRTCPVSPSDALVAGGAVHPVRFRGPLLERLERTVVAEEAPARLHELPLGAGRLLLCPLPVELAEDASAACAVYEVALARSGLEPSVAVEPRLPGVLVRALAMPRGILLAVVSERDEPLSLRIAPRGLAPLPVSLPRGGSLLLGLEARTGKVVARSDTADPRSATRP